MTTAFQTVFDRAESISINKRPVTAQTISRSKIVRTVSRAGAAWTFEVKLPDGIPWTELRSPIEQIEALGRTQAGTVQLNNAGYTSWLIPYLGSSTLYYYGLWQATWTKGDDEIELGSTKPSLASGYHFRAGDVIQLPSDDGVGTRGSVYTVTADVAYNATTIPLNRPILDDTTTAQRSFWVAENVNWSVYCIELPQWTIFARDQVSWSGPFIFYEART